MNITLQSDAMRELLRRIDSVELSEADDQATDTSATAEEEPSPTPVGPEDGSIDQTQDDSDLEDLMTDPSEKSQTKFSVQTLADDLGMDNTPLFKQAFNMLRSGTEPSDPAEVQELAAAFTRLMSVDTSTAQRVVNRLRMIYRKPISAPDQTGQTT